MLNTYFYRDPKGDVWTPTCLNAGFIVVLSRFLGLFLLLKYLMCGIISLLEVMMMLVMPILINSNKHSHAKICNVEIKLKNAAKVKKNTDLKGFDQSDIIVNGASFNSSVYNVPKKNPNAHRFETLKYIDVLNQGLKVMDSTAISLCMDNNIPLIVFDMMTPGNMKRAAMGEKIGTYVGR